MLLRELITLMPLPSCCAAAAAGAGAAPVGILDLLLPNTMSVLIGRIEEALSVNVDKVCLALRVHQFLRWWSSGTSPGPP
jgi:hypothetical protein